MIDVNLKLSGYTNYGKIYRLVSNVNFHHGNMVCPILKHVEICYNVYSLLKRIVKHVEMCYNG